jgi:hypothetical protein
MDYYGVGPYDIYIFEFDEKGNVTGRVGITRNVTFPSVPENVPMRAAARDNTYYAPVARKFFKR